MEISNATNTTSHRHHQEEEEEEEEEERDNKYSDNNLPIIPIATSDQAVLTLTHDDHDQTSEENDNKNDKDQVEPTKRMLYRYMECMKNHAASIGGNSRDGCGEFIPSSSNNKNNNNRHHHHHESLYCSVCNCHRNFHRKESVHRDHHHLHHNTNMMRSRSFYPYNRRPPMIMPCNSYHIITSGSHKYSDEQEVPLDNNNNNIVGSSGNNKKRRFRTKFSQEQREKMLRFAEGVGWKIHKEEESVVKSFCQEIGVKRRVLKVWMHNNKNNKLPKTIHVKHPTSSS